MLDETSRPDSPEPDAPAAEPGVVVIAGRRYLTQPKIAEKFDKSTRTFQRWHDQGIGPVRVQIGGMILYPEDLIPAWLASHQRKPTRQLSRRRGSGDARPAA